ncbi:uncharacterized protein K452DRAFT_21692 [Aplosporella prunicola CBS 121167]|uniref:Uncharacterized protein n=1 Tax=Aplosporella prunicola CBS 121167 TaxID=1176127 RepID=A0A6A6BH98_9PEZI|nr:uncharacterized protein K452DRAFT_21692 [Aplosporella prunicola CBS 121167]KAF2142634.1 hypothetical protein K452DRAFT_21692 [Aplosporella prunicola CBS 121167]
MRTTSKAYVPPPIPRLISHLPSPLRAPDSATHTYIMHPRNCYPAARMTFSSRKPSPSPATSTINSGAAPSPIPLFNLPQLTPPGPQTRFPPPSSPFSAEGIAHRSAHDTALDPTATRPGEPGVGAGTAPNWMFCCLQSAGSGIGVTGRALFGAWAATYHAAVVCCVDGGVGVRCGAGGVRRGPARSDTALHRHRLRACRFLDLFLRAYTTVALFLPVWCVGGWECVAVVACEVLAVCCWCFNLLLLYRVWSLLEGIYIDGDFVL